MDKNKNEYPSLYKRLLLFLLPFTTSYLCETGFSAILIIKIKLSNKVNVDPNLRFKLSNTGPDTSMLIAIMHIHPFY